MDIRVNKLETLGFIADYTQNHRGIIFPAIIGINSLSRQTCKRIA